MSVEDKPEDRLTQMERVVAEQEQAIHMIFATVQAMRRGDAEQTPQQDRAPMRDEIWSCSNCSARLGLYNKEREEMRVRYKDFLVYVKPGVGGVLRVPCRRCGEENILNSTD